MMAARRDLSDEEFRRLASGAATVEADAFGPKMLELDDGRMLKLFRIRRRWSSNLWRPYVKRFVLSAERLAQLGWITPKVERWGWAPSIRRQFALYPKLEGEPLRRLAAWDAAALGRAFAKLHRQGVYFRSCHLGNWLLTPAGDFALIDLADTAFFRSELRLSLRERNFRHLTRKDRDGFAWAWPSLIEAYLAESRLTERAKQRLASALADVRDR